MNIKVSFDMTEFNAALQAVARDSSRDLPLVINSQGFHLARRALKLTKRADPDKLAVQLGQVATNYGYTRGKKNVKLYRRKKPIRVFDDSTHDTLAHRLVNARRIKEGLRGIWGSELDARAKKLRTARLRSINFIRSGWIPALRKFFRYIAKGSRAYDRSVRQIGKPKGYGSPAPRKTMTPVAEIANSAILPQSRFSAKKGNPFPIAKIGLDLAIRESVLDMQRHLVERFQRNFDKRSAR